MPVVFFFVPYIVLWQPWPSSLSSCNSYYSSSHTSSRVGSSLPKSGLYGSEEVSNVWVYRLLSCNRQEDGSLWLCSEMAKNSAQVGLLTLDTSSPSSAAILAELYLSWLSSGYSPLGLWLSHLARRLLPELALSLRRRKTILQVYVCLLKNSHSNGYLFDRFQLSVFQPQMVSSVGRQTWKRWTISRLTYTSMSAEYNFGSVQLYPHLTPLPSSITQLRITYWRKPVSPWPDFICERHQCYQRTRRLLAWRHRIRE